MNRANLAPKPDMPQPPDSQPDPVMATGTFEKQAGPFPRGIYRVQNRWQIMKGQDRVIIFAVGFVSTYPL